MKQSGVFLFLILLACNKSVCEDQPLSLELSPVVNCPLKTNGYYYSDVDGKSFRFAVFYLNGMMINTAFSDVVVAENFMKGKSELAIGKDEWGLFAVSSSQIHIASRIPRPCGLWAELRSGRILNDSTFVLDDQEIKSRNETKTAAINQVYHFRQFDSKPDSMNHIFK